MKSNTSKSPGRPKRQDKDNATAPSITKGTKPGERRKTYLVNIEMASKVDAIAYWDRKSLKHVVNEAFSTYVTDWEKKNGSVKEPE